MTTKLAILALIAVTPLMQGKDKKADPKDANYQMGTYIPVGLVADGTVTDNFHCGDASLGSTTCAGGMYANVVVIYQIQAADGLWTLETRRQAGDDLLRRMGQTPMHFSVEKPNPLDLLKSGDKVLFRVEKHRKLMGVETDIYIPFAADPNTGVMFATSFVPNVAPELPKPPVSDNVRAICDSHKLTADAQKMFCSGAGK